MSWLLKLFPGQWFIYAAVLAASFAAGGAAAWQFQSMRADAKEKDRVTQQLADSQEAAKMERLRQNAVIDAQNSARAREIRLRADADGARTELGGLRNATAGALQAASASHAACLERADAFSVVLNLCANQYQGLAATADRIASDRQTLIEAWPK